MSFCLKCGKETKNNTKFCCHSCANKYNAKIQSETQKNKSPEEKLKIIEKMKQTSLKNWGTAFPMQSAAVKDKLKQSNLKNYGVENPFQAEECKEKAKQTKLEKYNDPSYNNREKCKKQI